LDGVLRAQGAAVGLRVEGAARGPSEQRPRGGLHGGRCLGGRRHLDGGDDAGVEALDPGDNLLGGEGRPDTDLLCDDIGVLISRLLQHGDSPAALAAGLGRLGDGKSPASIIGAIADVLAAKAAGTPLPGGAGT
ncbi:MAG: hypothetical protein IH888_13120, partial [Planctomycetes bacterium]|nr:hypothetical protein [Planctomycetota bacterium]